MAVVQLARKWHILGEVSSGESGGAHQQLKLCCLLVAIPLDSSKKRRKVLPSISCQEDAYPCIAHPGVTGSQLAGLFLLSQDRIPRLPSASLSDIA